METATTTPSKSSNPDPDAALLKGGPAGEHGKEMPKDGEPHPDSTPKTTPKTTEQVKYELNGKSFSSAEEMSKYVADLEQKVINQPRSGVETQPQRIIPQKVVIDGMTLDQLMFANPERYHQYVLEEAKRLAKGEIDQVENRKTFWSDFYQNNPDLRGKEELVDAIVAKNWTTWEKLPVKDFAKVVSDHSRSVMKKIGPANAEEVKQREAAALGTSGHHAPVIETQRRETSFVEELKSRSLKRSKSKAN